MAKRALPSRLRSILPVLALAAAPGACDLFTGPGSPGAQPPLLTALPRTLSAAERQVIAGSNGFAFGLLGAGTRRDTATNVFLSPLSASMALGMAMNGARGTTLDEMRGTLGFGGASLAEADGAYRSLLDLLRGLDDGVDVRVANSVWTRQGFPFEQSFLDTVHTYFDAEAAALDFSSPQAAPTINDWVSRSTDGRITDIVADPIDASMVMFLINAVYFKGSWRDRFDPADTHDAPFTTDAGATRTVSMMHRHGDVAYFSGPGGATGVELPYSRGAYVMDLVLPPEGTRLADFVAALDTARWDAWMAGLDGVELDLAMPRLRLSYETALNEPLQDLGMRAAFSPDAADFTGMSAGGGLFISSVTQKTFVNVDEEGTEAAAATAVGIGVTSVPQTVTFTLDRPFLLAIRERLSGSILFLGAIGAPDSP